VTIEIATVVFGILVPALFIGIIVYVAVRLAIRHESRRRD